MAAMDVMEIVPSCEDQVPRNDGHGHEVVIYEVLVERTHHRSWNRSGLRQSGH